MVLNTLGLCSYPARVKTPSYPSKATLDATKASSRALMRQRLLDSVAESDSDMPLPVVGKLHSLKSLSSLREVMRAEDQEEESGTDKVQAFEDAIAKENAKEHEKSKAVRQVPKQSTATATVGST